MIQIPKQLHNPEFRFVKLGQWNKWGRYEIDEKTKKQKLVETKEVSPEEYDLINKKIWKALGKAPLEFAWQKKGYAFNDESLLKYEKNFGVIGGYGRLRILDIDDEELGKELESTMNTFTIKTGSGGKHFYFLSDWEENKVLDSDQGEIRAHNYQVVSSPSRHPNGELYKIHIDKPLREISKEEVDKIVKPYLKKETPTTTGDKKGKDTSNSGKEFGIIINLIKKGLTKEKIWGDMMLYSKWSTSPEAYKEMTYEKAVVAAKEDKEKNKEDKKNTKYINRYVDEDAQIIVEQVYSKKRNESALCIYDNKTGKIQTVKSWRHKGFKFLPQEGEEIEKGAVQLPLRPEDYEDEKLDKEIKDFIIRWLDVPEQVIKFGIWNTKRSWVYDKFHTLNYLRALGDTGVGKSRYLNTFGFIHYTPIFTTGATTPAPLFRILDKWGGTLVMDEADLKNSDESEDIIKIINQGFEKGSFIMRCDQNDASKISFFDPYSPKILATRRTFKDKATESRCITHVMDVTDRTDIQVNLDETFYAEAQSIRNKLLMWRFRNYFKIDLTKTYKLEGLEPRVKQIVSSYAALFGDNEEQMKDFNEYILSYQEDLIEERRQSFEGSIVGAIHKMIEEGKTDFTSGEIISVGNFTGKTGKPMQPRGLNSYLKSLGFKKSEVVKVFGKTKRCVPINQEHVQKLFLRYGYGVTEVTVVTETPQKYINSELTLKTEKRGNSRANRIDRNDSNCVTNKNDKSVTLKKEQK